MSIASEITALNTNLTAAKNAVVAKGGTVGDTGLAGLAAEIATIPSGGTPVAPETLYGSALVYPFARVEYGLNPDYPEIWGCTINSIDQNKLGTFLEEYPPMSADRIYFNYEEDYENPGNYVWNYEYEDPDQGYLRLKIQEADMASTTGIDVEVNSGETYASFSIEKVTIVNTDVSGWLNVLSSSEYDDIVDKTALGEGQYTIGGISILREQVKGFAFGSTNTTAASFAYHENFEVLNFDYASSLTSIDNDFLRDCPKFNQSPAIPNTVTSIGYNFLYHCSSFDQNVTIPDSVTTIGAGFLSSCDKFNHSLTLPSGLTGIADSFLHSDSRFNQPLTIPSGVTTIGHYFMNGCNVFNQPLTIPSGVTSIGQSFMSSCFVFNYPLTIPSGVTAIANNFMYSCQAYNYPLTIPSGVTTIGEGFMRNCRNFNQSIAVPNSVTSIGRYFMAGCIQFDQPLTLSSGLTAITSDFMNGCTNFSQPVVVPNSVTSIGDSFLYSCTRFNKPLTLPSSLQTIGRYFLQLCNSFNQPLTIPSGTTTIGSNFMSSWTQFNQPLTIPSSITSINANSFIYNCNAMTSTITVEAPITVIGSGSPNTALSTTVSTAPCYTTGITLAGTYANDWKTRLTDRTTSPYRKLIVA